MIQETIATGRDVNAAIDNGCRELGISREEDSFDFEIIAREKKGFLGLKTYPAKVRVFRELPDPVLPKEEPPKAAPAPAPRREQPATQAPAAAKPQAPRQEKPAREQAVPASAPAGEPQEKVQPAASQPPRREPHPPRERKPREQRPARPQEQRPPHEERAAAAPSPAPAPAKRAQVEVEPTDNVRARVERSAAYVERMLGIMGIQDVKVTPRYYEDNVCLQLAGTGLGVIIGRRGETLDSIQYLSSLVANRGEGDYIRVNIDSGNYREKRERTLEALARKLANTAVRTGKSTTLEPMNPYERRIIHGAVSQVKGATSTSVGVDPNRRVVISAVDAPPRRPAPEGTGRTGGGRRDRDRDRGRDDRRRDGRPPRRDDRRGGPRPPRVEGAEEVPKAPRPKLDDGPAPERVYTPKAEPVAPAPKLVEFTQEEREVTEKTSLYGKIEL